MKRIITLCLIILLCFSLSGCQRASFDPEDTLPPLAEDEKEVILLPSEEVIYGNIVAKLSPNVLVLEPGTQRMLKTWGERVYVITDDSERWYEGDEIEVAFSKAERPNDRSEYLRIYASWVEAPVKAYKPVLYFYPEEATVCSTTLTLTGELECSYPPIGERGWRSFTAHPDGTLLFPDGKQYYALYWEGMLSAKWDLSRGFCVKGEDTAAFLEWALAEQGLTFREANEFIMYWLPLMQGNPYNVITFQKEAYTDSARLTVEPMPDSLLRVFMVYYPSKEEVTIQPDTFEGFVREGFTVVEWGGSQIEAP